MVPEIIRDILDLAYFSEYLTPDWGGLCRYSLVSRVWSWHAQALLFANVVLDTQKQLLSFIAATDPGGERGSRLGNAVRILRLTLYPSSASGRISQEMLANILNRCPLLYEIRLSLIDLEEFDSLTLKNLSCTPPIHALRLQCKGGIAVFQLLEIWASIQFLVLKSSDLPDLIVRPDRRPPPFSLYEFRWEGRDVPPRNLIFWILEKSLDTLEILHLSRMPLEILQLAKNHGRRLRSLRLPEPQPGILYECTRLEELYVFFDGVLSINLLRACPPTLQHLAFALQGATTAAVQNVLKIRPPDLPSLRIVTCYNVGGPWSQLVSSREVCAAIGIGLVYHNDRGFLIGNPEDLVPASNFPREPSVSNFLAMDRAVSGRPSRSHSYTENSLQQFPAIVSLRTQTSIKRDLFIVPRPTVLSNYQEVEEPDPAILLDDPTPVSPSSLKLSDVAKIAVSWMRKRL